MNGAVVCSARLAVVVGVHLSLPRLSWLRL